VPLYIKMNKNNNPLKKIPVFLLFIGLYIISIQTMHAQSGQYIQMWGGPQYTGMLNYDDNHTTTTTGQGTVTFTGEEITDETYRWGGGFDYINNFTQNYGWQTGLYYSGQGQKYEGYVQNFYNPKDPNTYYFTSEVTMDYIRVPIMFRFNSILDGNDRINLSIFMGFQVGYLFNVTSKTSVNLVPDSTANKYRGFDYKQLYNALDVGLGAGAQFNVKISEKIAANLGIRFDRSIANIENHAFTLPGDAPVEDLYPLSTLKSSRTSHDDVLVRMPTQNISVNVYLGMTYKLKNGKPPKPHPVDDLPPE